MKASTPTRGHRGCGHRPARHGLAWALGEQRAADPSADHPAGHGGDEARDGALGEQRGRPRDRPPDVRPAPLGGEPDRADGHAGERAEGDRALARGEAQRDQLDQPRLDDVEREVRCRLPEDRARRAAPAARGCARKIATAPSAPPRPRRTRATTSPMPAASISRIGWQTSRNCGTAKSNSAWKVERPTRNEPARMNSLARARRRAFRASSACSRPRRAGSRRR